MDVIVIKEKNRQISSDVYPLYVSIDTKLTEGCVCVYIHTHTFGREYLLVLLQVLVLQFYAPMAIEKHSYPCQGKAGQ